MSELQHPVFGELRDPWDSRIWESFVTVCFTAPDAGWVDLVLVSSARGQHHVAFLSMVGVPFHDLLDWLNDIVGDKLPATVLLDEEGVHTRLSVLPYADQWLEFRALRLAEATQGPDGTWKEAPEHDAERGIVCRVRKYEFLVEWRRRFKDFIEHDFRPDAWDAGAWNRYLDDEEPYPRWADVRRLDFSKMDQWLKHNRPRTVVIERIVSGGQTGADRAALDWATEHGIPHGGWCPAGRRAEDGTIPARYRLDEMPDGGGYRRRTKANVRDSDATLVVSIEPLLTGGSKETVLFARRLAKPWLHVHPQMDWRAALRAWLSAVAIETLNVAGPRASREPAVAAFVRTVLDAVRAVSRTPPGEMSGRQDGRSGRLNSS